MTRHEPLRARWLLLPLGVALAVGVLLWQCVPPAVKPEVPAAPDVTVIVADPTRPVVPSPSPTLTPTVEPTEAIVRPTSTRVPTATPLPTSTVTPVLPSPTAAVQRG